MVINEHFQDQALSEVIKILEAKYDLIFAYDVRAIQNIEVNQKINKLPLSDALSAIFLPTGLTYQHNGQNQILLRKSADKQHFRISELSINGQVMDAESGSPLAYATIFCDQQNGTTTDVNGNFRLRTYAFSDSLMLTVQFLGYRSQKLYLSVSDQPLKIEIQLSPKIHAFEQITVLDQLPLYATDDLSNAMVFRPNAMDALPDFIGGKDLFRSLQLLPGISAHDDLSAGIKIRGAESDENMIVLDGMTLYNVGHFFGIFSAINPNIIDQVKVYKNAFPIEYGAYTAGVIEMESIALKRKRLKAGVELNLLTSNAYLQLPLASNMDLLVAGRITNQNLGNTTYFDLLNKQEIGAIAASDPLSTLSRKKLLSTKPDFRFYDLNGKWTWRVNPKTSIKANFYQGYDEYSYNYSNSFTNLQQGSEISNFERFEEDRSWSNNAYSLVVDHDWNKKWNSYITLGHTIYTTEGATESSLFRSDELRKDSFQIRNNAYNHLKSYDLNWKNTWKITPHQQLTFGYNFVHNNLDLSVNVGDSVIWDRQNTGTHHSLYTAYDWDRGPYHFSVGLRGTHYSETNQVYFSPRIQAQRTVGENWKLKASWSLQNQFLKQSTYENPFGRTTDYWVLADDRRLFPVSSSNHLMLGFNHRIAGFELDVEGYFNQTDGVVEQALIVPGFGADNIVAARLSRFTRYVGDRQSYGVDILLKKYINNYSSWVAYTLSRTTESYPRINRGASFASENDRRHQLKWVNQYKLGQWNFSATYIYTSGKTFTDLSKLEDQMEDRSDLNFNDIRSRLKPYHRIDLGINRSFKWKGMDARFGLSVFNLFNFKNLKYLQYIYSIPESRENNSSMKNSVIGTELELLGITPNLSFGIDF